MPVIEKDPSWICKGSANVEVRMHRQGLGLQAAQGVTEEMEGKEQWTVTDWQRETFWTVKRIEGYDSRGGWPNKKLRGRPETSETGREERRAHECMRLKIFISTGTL